MSDDLIVAETLSAAVVYAPGGVDALLEKLERDVRSISTDISTKEGRAAISSLAFKVSRSKTALDELGKNLVADWKARSALVDADRRRVRERLDALRDEVRKPLTEWEEAESARIVVHEHELRVIEQMARFNVAEPLAADVALRIAQLNTKVDAPREWHEFAKRAAETTAQVKASLLASHDAAVRREAERAELLKLRKEAEERAQRERDERLQREAADLARKIAEGEAAERALVQAAKEAAERARIDRERVAAEEARLAAEAAAEKAKREAEDAAIIAEQARIAAAEKARRDAEAAVEAERQRVRREKIAAEALVEARKADEKHRAEINGKIVGALMAAGLGKTTAKIVVEAIARGSIPHVRIEY